MRRAFAFLCLIPFVLASVATPLAAQQTGAVAAGAYVADFDTLWTTVRDGYAYLDGKGVDWNRVRDVYRPQAAAATSVRELIPVLERTLDELYDAHTHLKANTAHSWRLVPTGADVWAEWEGDRAVITQVRPGYSAELAGVREGMVVTAVNGVPIVQAVDARLGQVVAHARPQARQWALLSVLAGMHDTPRLLRVRGSDGGERDVRLDQPGQPKVDDGPQGGGVEWRRLDGRLGYVRLTDLSGDDVVPMFDAVLDSLRASRGLILDLRETAAGGNTSVAEPILGRFLAAAGGYQRVAPLTDTAYVRQVQPRGPWTYTAPVVVLVGRWTGSMGEGMAIGLDGLHRATVVGTPMAGLNGAVYDLVLPVSQVGVAYAAETLAHVDGTPRESWTPPVLVQPTEIAAARPASAVLRAGIDALQAAIAGHARR